MPPPPRLGLLALLALLAFGPRAPHAQTLLRALASPDEEYDGFFGNNVTATPDLDGDGRGDLAVRAVGEGFGVGRVYVFSGATGALLYPLDSPGGVADGYIGSDLSGVSDLDGDGAGDLVVGAAGQSDPFYRDGRVYVFSGATGTYLRTLVSPNPEEEGYFGYEVAGVADLNGDGQGDVLVGASESPGGLENAGRAYVFSGANGALLRTLVSPNAEAEADFGTVAGLGDLDGDGVGEIVVGAGEESLGPGLEAAGRAYVFSGATGQVLHTLESPNAEVGGIFGWSASAVPDADGDGREDIVVGAPLEGPAAIWLGRAYVFSGATGTLLHELASPNEQEGGNFARSASGVEDTDGDGRGDVVVGAFSEDAVPGLFNSGRAYVFSGATGEVLQTLKSPTPEFDGFFGISLAGVPDANGDGRGDLLIGAPGEDPGTSLREAGRAYLFSGSPRPVATEGGVPEALGLASPHPNPSRGRTTVAFTLAAPSPVRLSIYDALGREVAVLVSGTRAAGRHEAAFDGSGLPAGVYVVRLEAEGIVEARQLTLVR